MLYWLFSCALHTPIEPKQFNPDRLANVVCKESNAQRRRHGYTALNNNPILTEAARVYALELQKDLFFDHTHPTNENLREPKDRVYAVGGKNPNVSENIARITLIQVPLAQDNVVILDAKQYLFAHEQGGKPIPMHSYRSYGKAVVQAWLDSPGHRRNLLHKDANAIGCAHAIIDRSGGVPMVVSVQLFQHGETLRMKK
ncbi:MAG: CAP domain-containing protein [Myxococcota bacterium]|nr:CAP domain-containing protein [Myxococcota bacterium]